MSNQRDPFSPTRPFRQPPTGPLPGSGFPGGAFPSEGPTIPRSRDEHRGQATKPTMRRPGASPDPEPWRPPSLSLDDEFDHPSQRVTAPPPREAKAALSTPARRDVVTDPAPPDASPEEDDIFDRPTLDVVDESAELLGLGYTARRIPSPSGLRLAVPPLQSQVPTVPPPDEFELDLRNVDQLPSQGSLHVFMEEPASRELRLPPHGGAPSRRLPSERPSLGSSRPNLPPGRDLPPGREMNDRFAMGDFSGALEKARQILATDPLDREARAMASRCEEVLLDMYSSRIAGMHRTVRTVMGADQDALALARPPRRVLCSHWWTDTARSTTCSICVACRGWKPSASSAALVDQRVIELS